MPGGDTEVSLVDVHHIASVVATKILAEHDGSSGRHIGKAYNITEPEALSYYQALKCYRMQGIM